MVQFLTLRMTWPGYLVALTFFLLATLYGVITPIFESPDELWHYPVVWHIAQTGELPVQVSGVAQLWAHEGSQAPLYYLLAARLTAAIPADDLPVLLYHNPHADIGLVTPDGNANIVVHTRHEAWPWRGAVLAIHLVRLFSTLLATGTVLTVYALGRLLWPERPTFALLAMAFVAFNPMFLFIAGSVNNDNMIALTASLTLWQLAALFVRDANVPLPLWRWVGLGILAGLTALSKLSGLGMLALVGLSLLWWGWRGRSWRMALLGNSIVFSVATAVAGWWYWRNITLYGDWSGTQPILTLMAPRAFSPNPEQWLVEATGLLHSFWGVFGYFSILMPNPIYWLFNTLFAIGILGGLLPVLSGQVSHLSPDLHRLRPVLLLWVALIFAGLIWYTRLIPSSQGRLLFPAIAAIAIVWAAGWVSLLPSPCKKRWQRLWQSLPALVMLPVALWVPWGVIAPAYSRPEPMATLPPSVQPLTVTFGDVATLLGYEGAHTTVQPGDALSIRLYWQSEQPTTTDYSVFIHLVDEHKLIVTQRDLFHGLGVYPTSQWTDGALFVDTYVLQVPNTTLAPTSAQFVVGLYNQVTGERLPASTGDDSVRFGRIQIQPQAGAFPNPQMLFFDDGIALVGYDLDRQLVGRGDTVNLTLYWQARHLPAHNYKVFVQLMNDDTHKAAQRDREPQNGAAPTTAWQPGETIVDYYRLQIAQDTPPGIYKVVVGLYTRDTGERLPLLFDNQTSVQADSITLSSVQVE